MLCGAPPLVQRYGRSNQSSSQQGSSRSERQSTPAEQAYSSEMAMRQLAYCKSCTIWALRHLQAEACMSGVFRVCESETLDLLRFESQEALPIPMLRNDLGSHLQSKAHAKSSHRGRNLQPSIVLTFYSQVFMAALEPVNPRGLYTASLSLTINRATGDRSCL